MIKRIKNQGQNTENIVKFYESESPCCGDVRRDCQYTLTYTQTETISVLNVTEDGVNRALPCVPATTSAADTQTAIINTLRAAGYEDSKLTQDDQAFTGVSVVDNGSTLTITITGDVIIASIVTNSATRTFTERCTRQSRCTLTAEAVFVGGSGAATDLVINGTAYNLGTINPASDAASVVNTAISTALSSAGITGATAASTKNGSTSYNVIITNFPNTGYTLALGSVAASAIYLVPSNCAPTFV